MEFLTWGDAAIPASFTGGTQNNTINQGCYTALALDSSTTFTQSPAIYQAYANNTQGSAAGASTFLPAEGYHYIYTLGRVSGGTGQWAANLEMSGVIQG
jgi:hypothetical protein